MHAEGLSETRGLMARLQRELAQDLPDLDEAMQRACSEAYRRVESQIPEDTGALKKALTRYRDRAQVFRATAEGYEFGADLPQAHFQRRRIPDPDPEPMADALAQAVSDAIKGA